MKNLMIGLLAILLLSSCIKSKQGVGTVDAYVPVYGDKAAFLKVASKPPQPIEAAGKIATLGNTVFQVENGKGIHVIDISNPNNPVRKKFLDIPLCKELTLQSGFLYTNNLNDLVVVNVSNLDNITETARLANVFPDLEVQLPAENNIYFECPDPAKGYVTGWELKKVNNPSCSK